MTTIRQKFDRLFPYASTAAPFVTALINAEDIQEVADHAGNTWAERPKFWILTVPNPWGEFHKRAVGNYIRVTADFPGLKDGRVLFIEGRSGGLWDGEITLTCWG